MKLYHPHLADVAVDVDDAKVDDWTEQGWRKTAPKTDEAKATPKK
jgi:hypothetical protein